MDNKNIIFQMPFDESDGALVAYDYSSNRADGVVSGAHFVQGKTATPFPFPAMILARLTKAYCPHFPLTFRC